MVNPCRREPLRLGYGVLNIFDDDRFVGTCWSSAIANTVAPPTTIPKGSHDANPIAGRRRRLLCRTFVHPARTGCDLVLGLQRSWHRGQWHVHNNGHARFGRLLHRHRHHWLAQRRHYHRAGARRQCDSGQ